MKISRKLCRLHVILSILIGMIVLVGVIYVDDVEQYVLEMEAGENLRKEDIQRVEEREEKHHEMASESTTSTTPKTVDLGTESLSNESTLTPLSSNSSLSMQQEVAAALLELHSRVQSMDLGRYNSTAVGWCEHLTLLFSLWSQCVPKLSTLVSTKEVDEPSLLAHSKARRLQMELVIEWRHLLLYLKSRVHRGIPMSSATLDKTAILILEQRAVVMRLQYFTTDPLFLEQRQVVLAKYTQLMLEPFERMQATKTDCKSNMLWCALPMTGWGSRLSHATFCAMASIAHEQKFTLMSTYSIAGSEYMKPYSKHICTLQDVDWTKEAPKAAWPWRENGTNSSTLNNSIRKFKMQDLKELKIHAFVPPNLPFNSSVKSKVDTLVHNALPYYLSLYTHILQRPNKSLENSLDQIIIGKLKLNTTFEALPRNLLTIDSKAPLMAGIQVRRTDKVRESTLQPISKYMEHVEDFFSDWDLRRGKRQPRKVLVATDDRTVLTQLKAQYPEYQIYTIDEKDLSSSDLSERQMKKELLMLQMHLMARLDFVVCTFSSNIGRVLFQLRLRLDPEARISVRSLDVEWFVHGVGDPIALKAVEDSNKHTMDNINDKFELTFAKGDNITWVEVNGGKEHLWFDPIGVAEGLTTGTANNKEGWFPTFKAEKPWIFS